jgi:hypothetical protein
MPYRVDWLPGPMAALAHIWNQAVDRQAVADAADQIDDLLARNPLTAGTVQGSVFRLHIDPLEVIYSVSPADHRVEVSLVFYRP